MTNVRGTVGSSGRIRADMSGKQRLTGDIRVTTSKGEQWGGSYVFTPDDDEQVIPVGGYIMANDIIIEAIPSNYGKVSFNGYALRIV